MIVPGWHPPLTEFGYNVIPCRRFFGTAESGLREAWQLFSDSINQGTMAWKHGARDAKAPTLVCVIKPEGASPYLMLWVGPADIALDGGWLRLCKAAHVFEISEGVLCRRESLATRDDTGNFRKSQITTDHAHRHLPGPL